MSALELRAGIVQRIIAAFPELRSVAPHGGAVDEATLDRYTANSPSAFVVCLGPGVFEDAGDVVATWRWGVFLITRDATSPFRSRHDVGLDLAERIASLVVLERWSDLASGNATNVRVTNLFTDGTDSRGIGIWAVEWLQQAVAVPADSVDDMDAFLRAYTTYDVGGSDDTVVPEDHLDLPQEES